MHARAAGVRGAREHDADGVEQPALCLGLGTLAKLPIDAVAKVFSLLGRGLHRGLRQGGLVCDRLWLEPFWVPVFAMVLGYQRYSAVATRICAEYVSNTQNTPQNVGVVASARANTTLYPHGGFRLGITVS